MALKDFLFKKEEQPVKKAQPHFVPPTTIGTPTMPSTPMNVGGMDYVKHLDDVLRKNNQSGLDYLEFQDALNMLNGQPLSEQQKYAVTFPVFVGMGVTAAKLVESARGYLILLEKESADFNNEMERSKNVGITQKNQQMDKLKSDIEQLSQQIQQKTASIQKITQEVNETNSALALADNNFNLAYGNRVAIINDHITKIQSYLSNGKTS